MRLKAKDSFGDYGFWTKAAITRCGLLCASYLSETATYLELFEKMDSLWKYFEIGTLFCIIFRKVTYMENRPLNMYWTLVFGTRAQPVIRSHRRGHLASYIYAVRNHQRGLGSTQQCKMLRKWLLLLLLSSIDKLFFSCCLYIPWFFFPSSFWQQHKLHPLNNPKRFLFTDFFESIPLLSTSLLVTIIISTTSIYIDWLVQIIIKNKRS